MSNDAGRMLLHQSVRRGLFEAVAFAVERGAIGHPLGLSANGLHDRLLVR